MEKLRKHSLVRSKRLSETPLKVNKARTCIRRSPFLVAFILIRDVEDQAEEDDVRGGVSDQFVQRDLPVPNELVSREDLQMF